MIISSNKIFLLTIVLSAIYLTNCRGKVSPVTAQQVSQSAAVYDTVHYLATSLLGRVLPPGGFTRVSIPEQSFEHYLRSIPLRPKGSKVRYYNGQVKPANGVYCEVVDLEIGSRDLHQCADAVMRLRAEYLWRTEQYDKIYFNFTNGHRVAYSEWMKGRRMIVDGNKTNWNDRHQPSNSYGDFWKYMELIFTYAGTASLEKELISVPMSEMKAGDVLIQGGYPGHAVIVMDVVVKESTGEKLYLLAQSYMPAQELHILVNPSDEDGSPWYRLDDRELIKTPEWTFSKSDLRRFQR